MKKDLEKLKKDFEELVAKATDRDSLEELKNQFLGRKGKLKKLMKEVASLADEERKVIGKIGNEIKQALESAYGDKEKQIDLQEASSQQEREWIDITEPRQ